MNLTDLERCATYKRIDGHCTINCKLGLWGVAGPFSIELINDAMTHFEKHRQDGKYNKLLGSPEDK